MTTFDRGYQILDQAHQELSLGAHPDAFNTFCAALLEYRGALGSQWTEFAGKHFQNHPVRQLLHESPFARHAYAQPRGYAGDALTIDYIYGNVPLGGESALGRRLYEWEFDRPSPRAVRARRDLVAQRIDRVAERTSAPRILSVACGHLREAQASAAVREGAIGEFFALDQDPASIDVIQSEQPRVQTVCSSVKALIARKLNWTDLDFAYSMGLYDYLPQPVAVRLTTRLFEMIRPGGSILVANFHKASPDAAAMEMYMRWWLIYRDESEVEALAGEIDPGAVQSKTVWRDAEGNVVYLELEKGDPE